MSPMRGVKSIMDGPLFGGELKADENESGDEGSLGEDLLRLSVILYGVVVVVVVGFALCLIRGM